MSRYIDADALISEMGRCSYETWSKGVNPTWWAQAVKVKDNIVKCIERQPTADVVEVVRCKDCKYCVDLIMGGLWCEHPDNRNPLGCRPNDYCNDGERREDSE